MNKTILACLLVGVQALLINFAWGATTTIADDTPDYNQAQVGSLDIAFTGAVTQCSYTNADILTATSTSTTAGTCTPTLADYEATGALNNTRIGAAVTVFLRNATETSTGDSITINDPNDGVTHHFVTAAAAFASLPSDTLAPAATESGDDLWCRTSAGAFTVNTSGVPKFTAVPATANCQIFDLTATAVWSTVTTTTYVFANSCKAATENPAFALVQSPASNIGCDG